MSDQRLAADYTNWSTHDLINRVTQLEAQLRAQQASKHERSSSFDKRQKPMKPRKPSKTFDPDKYHSRLIALKFAYLGEKYNGFEHHSNNTTPMPTIEEELWRALRKTRLIFPTFRAGQSEEEVSWEGCEYSKCGRTDRGVSAFGQVIGLRVRSARPKATKRPAGGGEDASPAGDVVDGEGNEIAAEETAAFDPVGDELPYIQLLNRVLPPDIRILAWCPNPPENFSARFNCKERRYRYFFTNPAYTPLPATRAGRSGEGWLDIDAMNEAAKKYEGVHDFRNFCKVDPSKQLSNFGRRIFHAGIHPVQSEDGSTGSGRSLVPKLYYFEVRGSAFLWHQVRHLVAVLFLVGQRYEQPGIVDDLLNVKRNPARPVYDMASDVPLVLWDCIFPDPETLAVEDRTNSAAASPTGYEDGLHWIYIGEEAGGRDQAKRSRTAVEDGKYGRNGIMDELWALWRKRKMDEVLAWSLMEAVSAQGMQSDPRKPEPISSTEESARVFDGSEAPRTVGMYVPVLQRKRLETPEVVNARYALRKGINGVGKGLDDNNMDE